jgi:uncharacterized protein YuzE
MRSMERTVRVTYAPDVDMGYLYLVDIPAGGVERTEAPIVETAGGRRLINLDFDSHGTLGGIEFDGARVSMPDRLIGGVG